MLDKITSWILTRNRVMPIDTEELTALELIGKTADKTNQVVDGHNVLEARANDLDIKKVSIVDLENNRKLSGKGDFTGTWCGLRPTQANESMTAIVEQHTSEIGEISTNVRQFKCDDDVMVQGDGVHDDTTGLQHAFDYAMEHGTNLYFPPGKYRTTSPIGFNGSLTNSKTFPTVYGAKATAVTNNVVNGVQDGSIILADHAGIALQICNTNTSQYFYGGSISDITILRKGQTKPSDGSTGLYLKGCVDYRMYNVVCMGFEKGFKNEYGWSWHAFGFTSVHCKYGIVLDNFSNACSFTGLQAHQNTIGIKILGGANIGFNGLTVETCDYGVVITKGSTESKPSLITLTNVYSENMVKGAFAIGHDENNVMSSEAINGITIDTFLSQVNNIIPISLDNCQGIKIKNVTFGYTNSLIKQTANTRNVTLEGFTGQQTALHLVNDNPATRINFKNTINLIPNGFLKFPDVSAFSSGGKTAVVDTTTFPGNKVIRITYPSDGISSTGTNIRVKIDKKMVGKTLFLALTGMADLGFDTSRITIYTPEYSGVTGGSVTIPATNALVQAGFKFICPDSDYIRVTIQAKNSSGVDKYIYIKELVLVEDNTGTIEYSPIDYLSGMSGVAAATTTGTIVPLPGYEREMYEVIITCYGNFTAYVTKATNQFTITATANGNVSYLIIPKCGMYI